MQQICTDPVVDLQAPPPEDSGKTKKPPSRGEKKRMAGKKDKQEEEDAPPPTPPADAAGWDILVDVSASCTKTCKRCARAPVCGCLGAEGVPLVCAWLDLDLCMRVLFDCLASPARARAYAFLDGDAQPERAPTASFALP